MKYFVLEKKRCFNFYTNEYWHFSERRHLRTLPFGLCSLPQPSKKIVIHDGKWVWIILWLNFMDNTKPTKRMRSRIRPHLVLISGNERSPQAIKKTKWKKITFFSLVFFIFHAFFSQVSHQIKRKSEHQNRKKNILYPYFLKFFWYWSQCSINLSWKNFLIIFRFLDLMFTKRQLRNPHTTNKS